MKRVGNNVSNQTYNPRNVKPFMPIDIDEVDMAMERFIRQKYESKALSGGDVPFAARHNTGSTSSDDKPPPLPPKPGKRFGFGLRASSSTFPQSRSAGNNSSVSMQQNGHTIQQSSRRANKAPRVFGSNVTSIQNTSPEDIAAKLVLLKEMGFVDDERNLILLKTLNGDIDRSVETLTRLGEVSGHASSGRFTPAPPPKNDEVNGMTIEKKREEPSTKAENLFGLREEPLPEKLVPTSFQQSVNPLQPSQASKSPFDQASQSPPTFQQLEQSFQSLQVSQQANAQQMQPPPLFPNATGGYGIATQHQQTSHEMPFFSSGLQTQAHYGSVPNISTLQTQQPLQGQPYQYGNFGGNPFLRTSQSQIFSSSNPFNSSSTTSWNSLSARPSGEQQLSPTSSHVPDPFNSLSHSFYQQEQPQSHLQAIPQETQQTIQPLQQLQIKQQQLYQQHLHQSSPSEPSFYSQQQPVGHSQQTLQAAQSIPRAYDKTSILALYNYPQLAPTPTGGGGGGGGIGASSQPPDQSGPKLRSATMPLLSVTSASNETESIPVTSPLAQQSTASSTQTVESKSSIPSVTAQTIQNSRNPFTAAAAAAAAAAEPPVSKPIDRHTMVTMTNTTTTTNTNNKNISSNINNTDNAPNPQDRQLSRDSIDFAGLMAAGGHSPDAFASLSARFV